MNSGLIAARYAKAFLEYVNGRGSVDDVYNQVRVILSAMGKLPKFRLAITDSKALAMDRKLELLAASVDPQPLAKEIADLLALMQKNSRVEFFRLTLLDFLNLYRDERNIVMVQLTTATEQPKLVPLIEKLVREDFGKTADINRKIDPDIVGGFIFESWGYRIDASVRRDLDELRDELLEKNTRLV